ncbi:MAG TPA: SIS domain-containing protein [Pyrinomonadaceae bacterium]|jgi:D-sedoheptulose 7-phosphate isomerase|nr:SIS domain-containing protein [Pyrinomonadaceae bacterium]
MTDKNRIFIEDYLAEIQHGISALSTLEIDQVVATLRQARFAGRFVFTMGNGGSASTASHFAHDLIKSAHREGRPRFKAIALSDSIPLITAVANDCSYELIFVEQLEALANKGDILVAFSGSGNSPNILAATDWAVENGLTVIGFTGMAASSLQSRVHICLQVQNKIMGQIEGIHLILTQLIYKMLGDL